MRAGCPWRNLQPTLDGLTQAGFSVAVYEEEETGPPPKGQKKKPRYLAQVVSSGSCRIPLRLPRARVAIYLARESGLWRVLAQLARDQPRVLFEHVSGII